MSLVTRKAHMCYRSIKNKFSLNNGKRKRKAVMHALFICALLCADKKAHCFSKRTQSTQQLRPQTYK